MIEEQIFKNAKTRERKKICETYFNGVCVETLISYLQYHKQDNTFRNLRETSLEDLQWLEEFCKKSKHERTSEIYKNTCIRRYGEDYFKDHAAKGRITKKEHYGEDFDKLMIQKAKEAGLKNDPNLQKHNAQKQYRTKLEKYGKEGLSERARIVAQKAIQIKKERYGENYFKELGLQSWEKVSKDPDKIEARNAKRKQTVQERYGGNGTRLLWQKSRETIQEKYGENFYSENSKKGLLTKLERYGTAWPSMNNISNEEKQVVGYIRSIYPGEIIENTFDILETGKELDIYIPEKNLAIEYNGFFWHSEAVIFRHKEMQNDIVTKRFHYKHYNKTLQCEKQNIRLIHILDLDWNNQEKQVIYKSLIASALGIYKQKYFARNLTFKEIDARVARRFLAENHLQGAAKASRYFALINKNQEPIQVMSFQMHSNHKHEECEMNRMTTLLNTQVVGGFSKLLKNSLKILNVEGCTSYIDRSVFNGSSYFDIGFKKVSETQPCYSYIYKGEVKRREFGMRKNIEKLYNQGEIKYWDPNESERINMIKNNIPRIWDCGKIKVLYTL